MTVFHNYAFFLQSFFCRLSPRSKRVGEPQNALLFFLVIHPLPSSQALCNRPSANLLCRSAFGGNFPRYSPSAVRPPPWVHLSSHPFLLLLDGLLTFLAGFLGFGRKSGRSSPQSPAHCFLFRKCLGFSFPKDEKYDFVWSRQKFIFPAPGNLLYLILGLSWSFTVIPRHTLHI